MNIISAVIIIVIYHSYEMLLMLMAFSMPKSMMPIIIRCKPKMTMVPMDIYMTIWDLILSAQRHKWMIARTEKEQTMK